MDAGIQWRFPYPFQAHETVPVTQLRSVEMGRNTPVPATGLRDSSMLTQDENIIDIRFTAQYRLKDARAFLFENRGPDEAVVQASESAVREMVGRSNVDAVLYRARDALAADLLSSVQAQLDRLNTGIQVVNINVQSVAVPDQVVAAFNDAVKATADRDRFKNEGQAYASDVIPRAQGSAARLREEAEGYRARVMSMAEGDCAALPLGGRRVQEGARRDPRSHVHRHHAAGVLERQQDPGRQPQRLEPAVSAAGQTDAAGGRGRCRDDAGTDARAGRSTGRAPGDARSRDGGRSRDRDVR